MHVITNEKWLAAVSGGVDRLPPSINGGGGANNSTNMSHAAAGTDSGYYGSAGVPPKEEGLGHVPTAGFAGVIITIGVGIAGAIVAALSD